MSAISTSPRTPFVDLAAQRSGLGDSLEQACLAALSRGDYILGEDVARFEEEFAAYCGVSHAVGVDSGTSALELALRAHGVGPGDEVITAANTFVATAFAISYCGATPVLVDIDPQTYNLDPMLVERAVTERTRAIMPVHLYGQPAEMAAISEIAAKHNLVVIEDACQAHGAREDAVRAGALGDCAAFSFYPAKNLGAQGDGGMVVTSDDEVAERLRLLRNYGASDKYHSEIVGYNRRLDTLQAAMLRVKLRRLDSWNEARRGCAGRYEELLEDLPIVLPVVRAGAESVWHLYVVRVAERDRVRQRLAERGIDTGIHYPVPLHLQPAYRHLGYAPGDFPVTERYAGEILSLPMYPELSSEAQQRVASALRTCTGESTAQPYAVAMRAGEP
jgi:dTDP-4-amino-4,6-dideoxygalactose transaminase